MSGSGKRDSPKANRSMPPRKRHLYNIAWCCVIVVITFLSIPPDLTPHADDAHPSIQKVWFYGWITALSTGLGIVPFLLIRGSPTLWLGVGNAMAGGMMTSASLCLLIEGLESQPFDGQVEQYFHFSNTTRTIVGLLIGIAFIRVSQIVLSKIEPLQMGSMTSVDTRRALLIILVMFLHSFAEGVGIGVSFGGRMSGRVGHGVSESPETLGTFISLTLAIHNIPEGLAIAVLFIPKGGEYLETTLWMILSSIPQPFLAVPSYLFVEQFYPLLPIGLGFASGAMLWMTFFELLPDAVKEIGYSRTCLVCVLAFAVMWITQSFLHNV